MTDKIVIEDLHLRTIIGINDDERINKQDVYLNLILWTHLHHPGRTDDIEDAVNYRTITKDVIDMVESSSYLLVEKLATEVAKLILQNDLVHRVGVEVAKPAALRFAKSVKVYIERTQNDLQETLCDQAKREREEREQAQQAQQNNNSSE